jgi:hypothetical protein
MPMPSLPSELAYVFIVAIITREFTIRRIGIGGCNNDVVDVSQQWIGQYHHFWIELAIIEERKWGVARIIEREVVVCIILLLTKHNTT